MQAKGIRTRGQSILVPPGISLKPTIEGHFLVGIKEISALDGRERAAAIFRLEYAPSVGRYEIASFGIDRGNLPLEISGAFLRTVRVHAIVRAAVQEALPIWTFPVWMLRDRRRADSLARPVSFDLKNPDTHLLTALVYRIAELSDDKPVEAVAETLDLKLRTATNWVARARSAGHLTETLEQSRVRRISLGLIDAMGLEPDISEKEQQEFLASVRGPEM